MDSSYGIDEALMREAARLTQTPDPTQPDANLDRLIGSLGPFPVAHFLVRSTDAKAVAALRRYLQLHWRAWANFIEQMIAAARKDRDRDFYQWAHEFGED
jgi:hypothetical protein